MKTTITLLALAASVLAGPSKQPKTAAPSIATAHVRATWGVYKRLDGEIPRDVVAELDWQPTLSPKFIEGSPVLFRLFLIGTTDEPDGHVVVMAKARCSESWNGESRAVVTTPMRDKAATVSMNLDFAGCIGGQQAHIVFWREPRDKADTAQRPVRFVLVVAEQ